MFRPMPALGFAVSAAFLLSACSSSPERSSSSATAASASSRPAPSASGPIAAASASAAAPVDTTPPDIAFFRGGLPPNVPLKLTGSSTELGFTVKRPDSWKFGGLPGDEMMMVANDNSAAIFCVYPGEGGDEDGVRATLKHAPILGTDYKQLSKNADVPIGAAKWPARTGYGTAKVLGEDGEVFWLRADMTLFLLAIKKSAPSAVREEAMAIARSMTAPKAAPP